MTDHSITSLLDILAIPLLCGLLLLLQRVYYANKRRNRYEAFRARMKAQFGEGCKLPEWGKK